jgi:glycosyltransferase involved in cell wall biosynthesis
MYASVKKPKRLSVCYAAPGHSLLETSGSTRNVLSLAEALSQWADVTVAFRSVQEPIPSDRYKVFAIEQGRVNTRHFKDDVAVRGLNPISYLSYLQTIAAFARRFSTSYDVVLEKGWRLSGYLCSAFAALGTPSVLVENDARRWSEPVNGVRSLFRYTLHGVSQGVAGFYSRRVPAVIAETDELGEALIKHRGIAPERLEVIDLGVDHSLFHPGDQLAARRALGIDPGAFLLLYVGGMDVNHDLGPVIQAFDKTRVSNVELHLVGDGKHRPEYQEQAKGQAAVKFHGHVPHSRVPTCIAAADLCIAPYRADAFYEGQVSFSTLKIPEYMACARPVISIPSGHVRKIIQHNVSGFLFPNDVDHWMSFLGMLPQRNQLITMGQAAKESVASQSWERTAVRYLETCHRVCGQRMRPFEEVAIQSH